MADGGNPFDLAALQRRCSARDAGLVCDVQRQLERTAERLAKRYRVDARDLVQAAVEVACELAPTYDKSMAPNFGAYIWQRAKGAMLDVCRLEAKQRARIAALDRAARVVMETVEQGDVFASEGERTQSYDDQRTAVFAGHLIGLMVLTPQSPEDEIVAREERARWRARIGAALAELEPDDKQLVVACAMEEKPLAEAARVVGMPYEKARYRFTSAMARVGKSLKRAA